MKKIAVIGATGMLGAPVTRQLMKAGFDVTALVRDPTSAAKKLPPGIQLKQGDIQDTTSIINFLKDNEGLYISLNLKRNERPNEFHAETDGLKNIIEAAKVTGINRIGFISSLVMNYQGMNGFNWWVFKVKKEAVNLLKSSGIPYCIFYPSTFMENFLSTYRMGNRVLLAGTSYQKMYFISAIDFGKQVASSFQFPFTENREYAIQGPEAYTADEAAKLFIQNHSQTKLSISHAPLGMLKFIGKFSRTINYGANIIEALNNYPERFDAEQTWKELGKPIITLQDFAADKFRE